MASNHNYYLPNSQLPSQFKQTNKTPHLHHNLRGRPSPTDPFLCQAELPWQIHILDGLSTYHPGKCLCAERGLRHAVACVASAEPQSGAAAQTLGNSANPRVAVAGEAHDTGPLEVGVHLVPLLRRSVLTAGL